MSTSRTVSNGTKVAEGVRRGLSLRCPECGEGHLYTRFLKVSPHCKVCGTDNTRFPSDDAPPYLTVLLVGHVILPFVMWMNEAWSLGMLALVCIWLPVITGMTVVMLPFVKGAVIGFAWANNVTRETARQ